MCTARGVLRVRFHIIRNARIENVGKYQSCMVSKLRIIWKQTVPHVLDSHNRAALKAADAASSLRSGGYKDSQGASSTYGSCAISLQCDASAPSSNSSVRADQCSCIHGGKSSSCSCPFLALYSRSSPCCTWKRRLKMRRRRPGCPRQGKTP